MNIEPMLKTEKSEAANVIPLPRRRAPRTKSKTRFKLKPHINSSGTVSFRVDGYKLDGSRVRMNFTHEAEAKAKLIELEAEFLQTDKRPEIQATKMTAPQIAMAESAFLRLGTGNDFELPLAIEHWLRTGRQAAPVESLRLDEAIAKFTTWAKDVKKFRKRTLANLKARLAKFSSGIPNLKVADITPEIIDGYLDKRNVSPASKDNDRRVISRFFSFCMDRKQRWATVNPCRAVKVEMPNGDELPPPAILTLAECQAFMEAAEQFKDGRLVPYVAACLFGGLRPDEAKLLTWDKVNLTDKEIRITPDTSKVKRGRVISMQVKDGKSHKDSPLYSWLSAYEGKPFCPANWRKDFDELKAAIGYGNAKRLPKRVVGTRAKWREWPSDVLRHTAISYHFRNCGSYGLTAEWAGNSEAIIKKHYQGRVSSEETRQFYAIMPTKKGGGK